MAVAGASKLGWMGEIEPHEDSDHDNAHAVGVLGRLDPAYKKSERVRAQAKSLAASASKMEDVFEKVRRYKHECSYYMSYYIIQ